MVLMILFSSKGFVMGIVVALTAIGRTISPLWRKFIHNLNVTDNYYNYMQWMLLMKE